MSRSEKWRQLMDSLGKTSCEDYRNVSANVLYLVMICLLYKATPMVASTCLHVLLRLRPYPVRGRRPMYHKSET